MDYDGLLDQVLALLQREKRLAYRVLKRRLQLDDETLEDLKDDLISPSTWRWMRRGRFWSGVGKLHYRLARHRVLP